MGCRAKGSLATSVPHLTSLRLGPARSSRVSAATGVGIQNRECHNCSVGSQKAAPNWVTWHTSTWKPGRLLDWSLNVAAHLKGEQKACSSLGSAVLFLFSMGLTQSSPEDTWFLADVVGLLIAELPRDLTSFIVSPCPIAASAEGASNSCCLKWRSPPCPGWRCSYLQWWTWVCSCHVMVNKPWLYDSHRSDAVRWALGCRGCCVGQKKVGEPAKWYPPCQVRRRVLIKRCLVSQAWWFSPSQCLCPQVCDLLHEMCIGPGFTVLSLDFVSECQAHAGEEGGVGFDWVLHEQKR